jgi:hypothetical protein
MTPSPKPYAAHLTIVRLTGAFALLFALIHLTIGVVGLTELGGLRESAEHVIGFAQKQNLKGFEGASADSMILYSKIRVFVALLVGSASAVCGVALLFGKRWAPGVWFTVISLVTLIYVFRFVTTSAGSDINVVTIALTVISVLLLCLSWFAMPRRGGRTE